MQQSTHIQDLTDTPKNKFSKWPKMHFIQVKKVFEKISKSHIHKANICFSKIVQNGQNAFYTIKQNKTFQKVFKQLKKCLEHFLSPIFENE